MHADFFVERLKNACWMYNTSDQKEQLSDLCKPWVVQACYVGLQMYQFHAKPSCIVVGHRC